MNDQEIIKQIFIYRCPVKLKEPFVISLGRLDNADNVIIVIETSGGYRGFGECSPFMTIHGETGETCMIVARLIAEKLKGKDALDISGCSSLMDAIIYGNTSIKSAFDIALYDIASQHAKVPLYEFLGGANNKVIATDYTVSFGDSDKMADDAEKIVASGFPVVKVKLGGSEDDDFVRIKKIRQKIGHQYPIRIDANQGWSVDTAMRILNRLEVFNIQHCEEPVSRKEFMSLPLIKSKSKIPIMADESCLDHYDASRLIEMDACSLLNVKLGKSSGIFKAMKITKLAEEAQMQLQMGGFLESRLGFTAAAHVALSSSQYVFFDFDTPLMFSEDFIVGGIRYEKNGVIRMPDGNGLGASVSDDVLNNFLKISV